MTQRLKIEDGPGTGHLEKVATTTPSIVTFKLDRELCDLTVIEIEAMDETGTCWRSKGAFRSGLRKGRSFTGHYNAVTRKGLLEVGRVEEGEEGGLPKREDMAA